MIGIRGICRAVDERTIIATILPYVVAGNSIPICYCNNKNAMFLTSIISSFVFDFFARFKMGGTNLNFFIIEQLATLSSESLSSSMNCLGGATPIDYLRPRVLELTYTTWDMKDFAEDLGFSGNPFAWNEERRFLIRAELDALFFHLYFPSESDGSWKRAKGETDTEIQGLKESFASPREAINHIMDSFWIRKERDEKAFGSYRTKEEILRVYDTMQECMRTGKAYESPLYGEDGKPLPLPATQQEEAHAR